MKRYFTLLFVIMSCALFAEFSGSLRMELRSDYVSAGENGVVYDRVNTAMVGDYRTGGTQGAISEFYHGSRTLASGATEVLGLVSSLTNSIGETVSFTTVKGIAFQNTTVTCTLTVGAGSLGIGTFTLSPWGAASFVGSFTVGTGADRITVTNTTGATATYRVWIVGE